MDEIVFSSGVLDKSEPPVQKYLFIKDLKPKDFIQSSFLVKRKELPLSKNGKPYLLMHLMDRTGEIDTRLWDDAERISDMFTEGDVVAIAGRVHHFQNRLQLIVSHLSPIAKAEVNIIDYLPAAPENLDSLYGDLICVFKELGNRWVRELGLCLLEDPEISERYKICPAAKTIHHAFIGGLLTHSLQVIRSVNAIFPLYPNIDRDILVFGAAFHDFGKIFELSYRNGVFTYTDEGRLVGHITIGVSLIDRKIQKMADFPKDLEWQLKHIVLSHHGHLEFGSPKRPVTLEAVILHALDDMDSKINSIQTLMESERNPLRWTGHHKAYDQYYLKPDAYLVHPPSAHERDD